MSDPNNFLLSEHSIASEHSIVSEHSIASEHRHSLTREEDGGLCRRCQAEIHPVAPTPALLAQKMAAEAKRWLELCQRRVLPRRQEQLGRLLESATPRAEGIAISLDVDWPSFAGNSVALSHLPNEGLGRVVDAVTSVCTTRKGKQRLLARLRRILLVNKSAQQPRGFSTNGTVATVAVALELGWRGAMGVEELAHALEFGAQSSVPSSGVLPSSGIGPKCV